MLQIDYQTAVYAYALKALCEKYGFSQDDLHFGRFSYILKINPKADHLKHVQQIPVHIDIPPEMLPEKDRGKLLVQTQVAFHDNSLYERYSPGLREFILYDPSQGDRPRKDRDSVRFWHWDGEIRDHPLYFTIIVEKNNLFRLRKFTRKIERNTTANICPPILPRGMLANIYKNTVGFLLEGKSQKNQYDKYDLPYKRGVLLCGKPGCGKTMTCKWLRNLAIDNDLYYRVVTLEEYEHARSHGLVRQLFVAQSNRPGIIFFDDLDVMVKDRKSGNLEILPFLTNMDGIYPTEGVVFVFTTNVIADLDEAFVRPGRIDLWLPFSPPGEKLRKQFVNERFHPNILSGINVDELVKKTDGYTFAEIEEIRKLFAFDIIAGKDVSSERIFKTFDRHRDEFQDRVKLGFNKMEDEDEEWDESDVELFKTLRSDSRDPGILGIPIPQPAIPMNDQNDGLS